MSLREQIKTAVISDADGVELACRPVAMSVSQTSDSCRRAPHTVHEIHQSRKIPPSLKQPARSARHRDYFLGTEFKLEVIYGPRFLTSGTKTDLYKQPAIILVTVMDG